GGWNAAWSGGMSQLAGLPIAEGEVIECAMFEARPEPQRPYVVKPLNEGSSVGVHLVFEGDNVTAKQLAADLRRYGTRILLERYIPRREIPVAVMGDRALGAIEIRTRHRFYDYTAKYTPGESQHLMPAPIHAESYKAACDLGLAAHQALGCRGVSRVDLRYDDTKGEPGALYVLEVNTQPGMTPTSLVPEIAQYNGIAFDALCSWMVENAACDG